MEHGRFDYSPIVQRPVLRMPNDARVALWVTPNVEHFHYDKPAMSLTPMTASLKPDVLNYAWRDYGARVGVWRLMEIFERQGIPVTAALNSEVCVHYPRDRRRGQSARLGMDGARPTTTRRCSPGMPEEAETRTHRRRARHDREVTPGSARAAGSVRR